MLSAKEVFLFMLPINGVLFIFSLITGGLAEMLIIIFYINMGRF